ncbi:MAG: sensor histidine kinase [Elusimicrobiales bacterium]
MLTVAIVKGAGSGGLLAALGLSLFAQLSVLPVIIDWIRARNGALMEQFYSGEDLYTLRRGFSMPLSLKIGLLIFTCALLPFAMSGGALFLNNDPAGWSRAFTNLLGMCGVTLVLGLGVLFYGVQRPLDALIARMERVPGGDYSRSRIYFSDEIARLKAGFNGMTDGLREREARLAEALARSSRLESELAVARATADLAARVAHDIRSPLASLNAATRYLEMPDEQRRLVENTVGRLKAIADDLLYRYRAPGEARTGAAPKADPASLLEEVVAEKRLQYRARPGLKIELSAGPGRLPDGAAPAELQRSVANLITNSAEAIEGAGEIAVGLSQEGRELRISVKDTGKGIPAELLPRLGRKGETHGKPGGNGLGLYGARAFAESCGGRLAIESAPGGTAVTLALPLPADAAAKAPAALLDNDLLVHMNWKFAAAQAGVPLQTFTTGEDFLAALPRLDKATRLYIDSDLGGGAEGEPLALAAREAGFGDITMETGHPPEKFAGLPWLKVIGKDPPWR